MKDGNHLCLCIEVNRKGEVERLTDEQTEKGRADVDRYIYKQKYNDIDTITVKSLKVLFTCKKFLIEKNCSPIIERKGR